MHDRHSSSGRFGGAIGAALTTAAVIAGIGIGSRGQHVVSAQQTMGPQRKAPAAASTAAKPAATLQHAVLPPREVCSNMDYSDGSTSTLGCTNDIRMPGDARLFVGYVHSSTGLIGSSDNESRARIGMYFDLSSLQGAELQTATLTVQVKEKQWCGRKIGISAGNLKVSKVKAASYEDSGPTQTINVTSLLKPIVANNGRGFGGFVITSDTETLPWNKITDTCLSTITEARLAVDYLK